MYNMCTHKQWKDVRSLPVAQFLHAHHLLKHIRIKHAYELLPRCHNLLSRTKIPDWLLLTTRRICQNAMPRYFKASSIIIHHATMHDNTTTWLLYSLNFTLVIIWTGRSVCYRERASGIPWMGEGASQAIWQAEEVSISHGAYFSNTPARWFSSNQRSLYFLYCSSNLRQPNSAISSRFLSLAMESATPVSWSTLPASWGGFLLFHAGGQLLSMSASLACDESWDWLMMESTNLIP